MALRFLCLGQICLIIILVVVLTWHLRILSRLVLSGLLGLVWVSRAARIWKRTLLIWLLYTDLVVVGSREVLIFEGLMLLLIKGTYLRLIGG